MADPPGATLIIRSGIPDPGNIKLGSLIHVLGRSPSDDIGLDNPFVSSRHAEIAYTGSGYTIRDLGSRNGTIVNGALLDDRARPIRGGDIIEFGKGQVVATFSVVGDGTQTLPGPIIVTTTPVDPPPIVTREQGLYVDMAARDVYVDGTIIERRCSAKQFSILAMLYERRGEACSKDSIAAAGWPERQDGGVADAEIGANIFRLRQRVEPDPGAPRFIETIPGYGYKLNADA